MEFVFADENKVKMDESSREPLGENLIHQGSNQVHHFTWDKHTTQLLVECYMHLKDAFRDPKIKKKKLWDEIKTTFMSKGHNITEEALDRKWRNMKKTYTGIRDNVRKTGRVRIMWDYFHQFDEIYRPDRTINLPQTIESEQVDVKEFPLNLEFTIEPSAIDQPQPSLPATPQVKKEDISPAPRPKKTDSKSGMFYLRKRLANIEEARVKEIKLLRDALEENNKIQEERNIILRELCELQKKNNVVFE